MKRNALIYLLILFLTISSVSAVNNTENVSPEVINISQEYTVIIPEINDTIKFNDSILVNFSSSDNFTTNLSNNDTIDECNFSFNIDVNKNIFELGEKQTFRIYANNISKTKYKYLVEYWVEDLFGNIIKKKINTTSTSIKSFTPNFEEEEKTFVIKSKIHECDMETYELFSVKSNIEQEEKETDIEISFPEKVKYEDNFIVELEGFKANTGKTLLSIWVEDENRISEVTKVYIMQKYKDFHFKVPVVFKDIKIEDKEYSVVIEGLDIRKEKPIEIDYEEEIEENNNKEEKIISNNKISSFYTRKKNFEPEIKVYITLKKYEPNLILSVHSSNQTKNISIKNKSFETTINITCSGLVCKACRFREEIKKSRHA